MYFKNYGENISSVLYIELDSHKFSPTSGRTVLRSKLVDREDVDSIPGRACRLNRSKISVVFSETRLNRIHYNPLNRVGIH